MEAPAISTLQDEESPSPPLAYGTASPIVAERAPKLPSVKVKLRVPANAGITIKPHDELESEDEDIDELQDDDEPSQSTPATFNPPPAQIKAPSTRGGKGSRGPRKKRAAVIGERVMSPPPKVIGTEWVVQVAPGQVPPEDPSWDSSSSKPGRGRRGAGKRAVPGPGRGWRRGLTKGQKAQWGPQAGGPSTSELTPTAFPATLPPPPATTVFREYHPPNSEIPPPSLQIPNIHHHAPKIHAPAGAPPHVLAAQHPHPPLQYPPPIVQPTLPPPPLQYLPHQPPQPPPQDIVMLPVGPGPDLAKLQYNHPSHGIPSRPFPVQPAPKPSGAPPQAQPQPLDKSGLKVRKWTNARREIKGIAGSRWLVRTWIGEKESEYSRSRTYQPPQELVFPPKFRFKQEFAGSTGTGTPDVLGTPDVSMDAITGPHNVVDLTGADASVDGTASAEPEAQMDVQL